MSVWLWVKRQISRLTVAFQLKFAIIYAVRQQQIIASCSEHVTEISDADPRFSNSCVELPSIDFITI